MKAHLIAEHPVMRVGLRRVIELEWDDAEVHEGHTLAQALKLLAHGPPDVIVLDTLLPDARGVDAIARLRSASADVPVVMIGPDPRAALTHQLMRAGADSVVTRERTGEDLIPAITRVLALGRHEPEASVLPADTLLTPQERRVMQHLAAGHRTPQVASLMGLSVKTVTNYRMRIFAKMGWRSVEELTRHCAALPPGPPGD